MRNLLAILGVAIMAASLSFGANAQMMKSGAWQKHIATQAIATTDFRTTGAAGWQMPRGNPLFTLAQGG
jgi:hypothetical protein